MRSQEKSEGLGSPRCAAGLAARCRGCGFGGEGELLGLGSFGAGGALEGDIAHVRVVDALAVEEFRDGEDLETRVMQILGVALSPRRFVDSGSGGFGAHGLGSVFESDEDVARLSQREL